MKAMSSAGYLLAAAALVTATPALAEEHIASVSGSYVHSSNARIEVTDNLCDNRSAYANYYRSGSGTQFRLDNWSGCGNKVTSTTSSVVTSVRACLNREADPDICSSWR